MGEELTRLFEGVRTVEVACSRTGDRRGNCEGDATARTGLERPAHRLFCLFHDSDRGIGIGIGIGSELEARPVDPRDVNIAVDAPMFRVHFWRSAPSLACREFEVTGGDVDEIIEWAEDNKAADETYELGVLTRVAGMHDGDVVLTRINGADPTRSEGGSGTSASSHV